MNINIIENNGAQASVSLISYFSDNGKNYIFYTKNEAVQDGLIKIYVASQNNGVNEGISDDEWINLKKIMQNIIMGNATITYLNYSGTIQFNESRAIALKEDNINSIKTAYNSSVGTSTDNGGTNKDLLSQSFGGEVNTPEVTPSQDVQVSPIPDVQNNFNMESTPVNLNTTPTSPLESTTSIPQQVEAVPTIEPTTPAVDNLNPLSTPALDSTVTPAPETPLTINNIKEPDADNVFNVSSEPNIFDQPATVSPFNITEEEINKPVDLSNNSILEPENIDITPNDSSATPEITPITSEVNNSPSNATTDNSAQIALNERKIKLFEELASIYKEENELLKGDSNSSMEQTASNLFNNNGTLDEFKVLEN